jgi:2-polyprenyl-3-methyl-5-hydroxy-6-metoxy-1,4-benzoquinol methylase
MDGPRDGYWSECPRCGYMSSVLQASIRADTGPRAIDEAARVHALGAIRRANFDRILDVIERLRPGQRGRVLDVGAGYGWFLDAAASRGYEVTGIEPDRGDAAHARKHAVIDGFFPADLPAGAVYDVITFHDVFEHLDDPGAVARSIHERLSDGGLAVVNIPNSRGILFRIARTLNAAGIHRPFDRMWQRGLPSPHRSYFHPDALADVFKKAGFREVHRSALPSMSREGLWSRLRFDRSMPVAASVAVWVALTAGWPVLRVLPSDISLHVFEKVGVMRQDNNA